MMRDADLGGEAPRSVSPHGDKKPTAPDPNATGASEPLPGRGPGIPGREAHERAAARRRGQGSVPPAVVIDGRDRFAALPVNHLFEVLADSVRDYAVFLTDPNGIIVYWGEGARLIKWWTKEQAEGGHLRMLYPDGGAEDGTAEGHLQVAAEQGEYTGEGSRIRSDGSIFWAGVTLTALRDVDGTLLGFAKVTRDFSARRAVEAALADVKAAEESQRTAEEANRFKTLFIASISHEIRSPLNALLGYLDLLERESGGPERQRAHIARARRSARHLLQIVADVLDMSRIESGRIALHTSASRLGAVIEGALSDIEPAATAKGVRVSNAVSGSAADLSYWGDEARVRQILINLLSNATKFTAHGGTITISAGTTASAVDAELPGEGPWLFVRVEDSGEGIAADRLAAIFEPFEQARATDSARGTGLGLAISRRLARLMGGDLTVRSSPGVGSSFFLWLPLAPAHPVPR